VIAPQDVNGIAATWNPQKVRRSVARHLISDTDPVRCLHILGDRSLAHGSPSTRQSSLPDHGEESPRARYTLQFVLSLVLELDTRASDEHRHRS
jgi:hypothetical protein